MIFYVCLHEFLNLMHCECKHLDVSLVSMYTLFVVSYSCNHVGQGTHLGHFCTCVLAVFFSFFEIIIKIVGHS